MRKEIIGTILIASLFFILLSFCTPVNAANYGTLNSRINKNNQMINTANKLNSVARSGYTDKYLKDLSETSYKALTSTQQSKIQSLANNTILNGTPNNYTDLEKLELFDNWIIKNFYYYSIPSKIANLGTNCNNPYYLLTNEYDKTGKIRAKSNGYSSMLIALARSQGIPSRLVGGYYNENVRDEYSDWGSSITKEIINHVWVEAYIGNKWIMIDPAADSYKSYNATSKEYENNYVDEENYQKRYFNPNSETLGKTNIAFRTYAGSKTAKYIYNSYERKQLQTFLNIKYKNITNGKRINSTYTLGNAKYWFSKTDTKSSTNGYGNLVRLYFPASKSIYGNLNLNSFTKLESLHITSNKVTNLTVTNAKSLRTVNVTNNNIKNVIVTGSFKLSSLKTRLNSSTYIKYNFGSKKRTAVIKAKKGGTVSVYYLKGKMHNHYLNAIPKKGYVFDGWYKNNKKVSKSKLFLTHKSKSFVYYAKFKKSDPRTYIKVSISKQKLWYYKKGELKYKSRVVTGQPYEHSTPRGVYEILGKARHIYLIGDDYKVFVNYWMLIDHSKQIGLHDATWRSDFGGNIYEYYGSHGCINLPYKTAKYMYNHVPVGTKVKVVK